MKYRSVSDSSSNSNRRGRKACSDCYAHWGDGERLTATRNSDIVGVAGIAGLEAVAARVC